MAKKGVLELKAIGDASGIKKMTKEVNGSLGDMSGFVKKAVGAFAAFAVVSKAADFMGDAISAASDLSETMTKSSVVFGDYAADMEKFGETAAKSMGQSKNQAIGAAATFGNLFVSMGFATKASADMSKELVVLASDLSSFNNVPVDDALLALRSGLTGETEPLKRFGINLNEAALKAEALRLGIHKGNGTLSAAAKAQSAYSLILGQSATAQGDFARTSDGLANQQKILGATWEDLKATLGEKLLPVAQKLIGLVIDNMPAIEAGLSEIFDLAKGTWEFLERINPGNWFDFADDNEKLIATVEAAQELETIVAGWKRTAEGYEMWGKMLDEAAVATEELDAALVEVKPDLKAFGDTIDDVYGRISKGADSAADSIQGVLDAQREQAAAWYNYRENAVDFINKWKGIYDPEVLKEAIADPNRLALMMGGTEAEVAQWMENIAFFMQDNAGVLKEAVNNALSTDARSAAVATAIRYTGELARKLALANFSINIKANPIINWAALPSGLSYYTHAAGGLITRPQMGIVGEAGAERILSAQQTAAFERLVDVLDRGNLGSTSYNMYTDQATMNAYSRQRSHALMGMG